MSCTTFRFLTSTMSLHLDHYPHFHSFSQVCIHTNSLAFSLSHTSQCKKLYCPVHFQSFSLTQTILHTHSWYIDWQNCSYKPLTICEYPCICLWILEMLLMLFNLQMLLFLKGYSQQSIRCPLQFLPLTWMSSHGEYAQQTSVFFKTDHTAFSSGPFYETARECMLMLVVLNRDNAVRQ